MIHLPEALRAAIEELLAQERPRATARRADALSARYRAGDTSRALRNPRQVTAYLAQLLPATYAQISGALAQVAPLLPSAQTPRSLLDLGSGPGTAIWAAGSIWPQIETAIAIDREAAALGIAHSLATAGAKSGHRLPPTQWLQEDLLQATLPGADLVICAHLLTEIPRNARAQLLERAWAATRTLLVIIEPGTPSAFATIREARAQLLAGGARQLAPCPHQAPCPLPAEVWCHFPQRLERPPFQRQTKGALLGWEDAKYSFTACARVPATPALPYARLIGQPRHGRGRVRLPLCTADGLADPVIPRSRPNYRQLKKISWGAPIASAAEITPTRASTSTRQPPQKPSA